MTAIRTPKASGGDRLDIVSQRGIYTSLGYRSVSVADREGRTYPSGSADSFLEIDRLSLIRQSRSFDRNNGIYTGIINTATRYIVGRGFGLRVLGEDTERNEAVEAAWRRWYRTADIRGMVSRQRLAAMVLRETLICGDVGQIKRDNGRIQVVEAEQITNGRHQSTGIDLDTDGRPTAFQVCSYNARGQISPTNAKKILAENFLFLTTPGRPSQTRGVPVLQASFPTIHRINDVCDSEALARQILSRLVMTITREQADRIAHAESIADPNKPNAASEGDVASRLMELDYAVIFHARPGEKVEGIERNIPGEDFEKIVRTFLRLMGLPLGLPLELILLDWSQANYSQSRAVLEQAYQTFLDWQDALEDYHYQPLLEWQWPALLKAAGYQRDDEIPPVEWIRPSFPWIDQLKEAQANGIKIDRCLTTHAHVLKEIGLDREQVVESRQREIVDAIQRAKTIKADTGVDVPWQHFAGMQSPKAETPAGLRDGAKRDENVTKDQEADDA